MQLDVLRQRSRDAHAGMLRILAARHPTPASHELAMSSGRCGSKRLARQVVGLRPTRRAGTSRATSRGHQSVAKSRTAHATKPGARHVLRSTSAPAQCRQGVKSSALKSKAASPCQPHTVGSSSSGCQTAAACQGYRRPSHASGASLRAARAATGAIATKCGRAFAELVGPASETDQQHRRRHPCMVPGCARCVYLQLRASLVDSYGTHRHEAAGKLVKTTWLAARPAKLGGSWALGCLFCAAYADTKNRIRRPPRRSLRGAGAQKIKRGSQGSVSRWSRFEISCLSQMASRGIRQHSETSTHRLAARAYFAVDKAAVCISSLVVKSSDTSADADLFRGGVPQVPDWLRAWRACRSPISFSAAEKHGITNNFINASRQNSLIRRKAFRSMVRVMMFAIRARKRAHLRTATSICISLDDRGAYRIIRYKCDRPYTPDIKLSDDWIASTSGVLSVLRRGGAPSTKTLAELSDDYSQKMADSVLRAIDRVCTGTDNVVDAALVTDIRAKIRIGVADGAGAAQKSLRCLAAGPCPNLLAIIRDLAHKARTSTKDPFVGHAKFKAWYDDVFDQRHALVPDIMNSDAWLEKLLLCQREVVKVSGCLGGGLQTVQHILRFAKQRFESEATPQRQFCCLLVALGMVLAFVACDPRADPETRARATRRLEEIPGYVLPQGLSASYSAEMLEFVRLFDRQDHDPALTWEEVKTWKQRVRSLFIDGQIFMDPGPGQGMSCLQIILEAARTAPPIYYGDKVLHLYSHPTRQTSEGYATGLQEATKLAVDRVDVEFDIHRPEVALTAMDIRRWSAASEELRQGRPDALNLLQEHGRRLFRIFQLSGSRGLPELEACAWTLVAEEKERRATSSGGTLPPPLDNRVLWSRTRHPDWVKRVKSSGEFQVLPLLVSLYLSCDDGTGQVERNLGKLKEVLDAHVGRTDEEGETIAWLTDILLDGPEDETGLAVCEQFPEVETIDPDITVDVDSRLFPTDFTRQCAELWVLLNGRRFRCYKERDATAKATAKAKPKAKATPGSMKAVAEACKLARDTLASRTGRADTDDVTLLGFKRSEIMNGGLQPTPPTRSIQNFTKTTARKRVAMQELKELRARGSRLGQNPYALGSLNPLKKPRLGPELSGCQGVPGPAVLGCRPGGPVRVLNCTGSELAALPGNFVIKPLRGDTVWDDWRRADLVVWDTPWHLDRQAAATSDFLKIAFLVIARGSAVLPKSAWRPGPTPPHRSPEIVRFSKASAMDEVTLVMGDAFRGVHPQLAQIITQACDNTKWKVVRVRPDDEPAAKAKAKAKGKAKAKAKAKAKGKARPPVELINVQSVRDFLQRIRRVNRCQDAGLAGAYFVPRAKAKAHA